MRVRVSFAIQPFEKQGCRAHARVLGILRQPRQRLVTSELDLIEWKGRRLRDARDECQHRIEIFDQAGDGDRQRLAVRGHLDRCAAPFNLLGEIVRRQVRGTAIDHARRERGEAGMRRWIERAARIEREHERDGGRHGIPPRDHDGARVETAARGPKR
jgi:hypothetical protein